MVDDMCRLALLPERGYWPAAFVTGPSMITEFLVRQSRAHQSFRQRQGFRDHGEIMAVEGQQ
jgi:hypothetical protein